MRQISLVGAVDEEVGDYFPEFLDMLEESPFLKVSKLTVLKIQNKGMMSVVEGGLLWKALNRNLTNLTALCHDSQIV